MTIQRAAARMPEMTITITGPYRKMVSVETALVALLPECKITKALPEVVNGYDEVAAKMLYNRLATPQRHILKEVLVFDGRLSCASLRDSRDTLRGVTGAISKHVKAMIKEGHLPEGTKPPTETHYYGSTHAQFIVMDPALVVLFKRALGML